MLTPAPSHGSGELARLIASVRAGTPAVQLAAARAEQTQIGGGSPASGQGPGQGQGSAVCPESDQLLLGRWLSDLELIAGICCDQQHVMSKELGARLLEQACRLRWYTQSSPARPEGAEPAAAVEPDR